MVNNWTRSLYPSRCLLCDARLEREPAICDDCWRELPRNQHACPRCAQPLPHSAPNDTLCGHCLDRPPPFRHIFAPFLYQPPIDWLITHFKHQHDLVAGRLLAELLLAELQGTEWQDATSAPISLVPIPLHQDRLRQRGFNQATELTRRLAKVLGIDWQGDWVTKIDASEPQQGLQRRERLKNLRRSFVARAPVPGRHLILVDDVVTTGATMEAVTRALNKMKVREVAAWAIARTP